jgi:hypothetical protein
LTLVSWLSGAGGLASLVLLAAIVACAARLIAAIGDAAEGRSDRFPVVTSAAGLACLVAAGAAHVSLLAAGVLACFGLEWLGSLTAPAAAVAEPRELIEAPVSRAA